MGQNPGSESKFNVFGSTTPGTGIVRVYTYAQTKRDHDSRQSMPIYVVVSFLLMVTIGQGRTNKLTKNVSISRCPTILPLVLLLP